MKMKYQLWHLLVLSLFCFCSFGDVLVSSDVGRLNEKYYIRVEAESSEDQDQSNSADSVNLCLVIDASGSMGGTPLHNAKNAAKQAVLKLKDTDIVSLITFNSNSETIFHGLKAGSHR